MTADSPRTLGAVVADWLVRAFSCNCRHPDARSCLMIRAAPGPENDPPEEERCGCGCHGDDAGRLDPRPGLG